MSTIGTDFVEYAQGHLDVVVALLEHGADVDLTTAKGNTALMYASAGGHVECANVVLEYGANCNVRSEADSDTPMHKAVRGILLFVHMQSDTRAHTHTTHTHKSESLNKQTTHKYAGNTKK